MMRVKNNLDKIIYDNIVNDIIDAQYKMGEIISIDHIAEKYETSRTPVSQAVKMLANDKLVEIMPNGRARIPVFDKKQIRKICDARYMLEKYAIEKICEKHDSITHDFYHDLTKEAISGEKALSDGETLQFNKRDINFHRMIVSCCDNEYIDDAYKQIQGRFIVANYLYNGSHSDNFDQAAKSHSEIVLSLQDGDLKKSLDLMSYHINCLSGTLAEGI